MADCTNANFLVSGHVENPLPLVALLRYKVADELGEWQQASKYERLRKPDGSFFGTKVVVEDDAVTPR